MRKLYSINAFSFLFVLIVFSSDSLSGQEIIKDFDGNSYKTVTIGTQVWMAENLRTTHYSTGEPIPEMKDDSVWAEISTGAYCINNNDKNNSGIYGYLYNWYVVPNARKLCPAGWHVPSANDWKKLETSLGGAGSAGGKMKEAGTTRWAGPNSEADNSSKFNGLPGGSRNSDGTFNVPGENGHWWTTTEFSTTTAWRRQLYNNAGFIDNVYALKNEGFSIRCVKD